MQYEHSVLYDTGLRFVLQETDRNTSTLVRYPPW